MNVRLSGVFSKFWISKHLDKHDAIWKSWNVALILFFIENLQNPDRRYFAVQIDDPKNKVAIPYPIKPRVMALSTLTTIDEQRETNPVDIP